MSPKGPGINRARSRGGSDTFTGRSSSRAASRVSRAALHNTSGRGGPRGAEGRNRTPAGHVDVPRRRRGARQPRRMDTPPSTSSAVPVVKLEASDAR